MSETEEKQTEYFKNERTGRYVKVGSSTYKRLIKELNCAAPIAQRVAPAEPAHNIKVQDVNHNDVLRHRLMEESTDMIRENMKSLENADNLSDKELDKMLRKLLINKLGLGEKKKSKRKTKKKARFKIVAPPPTSSESDSTDSD